MAEVALAVMLLVGAGLFVSSFLRLVSVDLGLDPSGVTTAGVNPRVDTVDAKGFDAARARTQVALASVLTRLSGTPGVVAVAAVGSGSPLSGSWRTDGITVPGKPEFTDAADPVQIREVTPGYLNVVRVPLKRGRYVSESDTAGAPLVVVLNEEAVARYFDGQDPIGTIVRLDAAERRVVGVVGNVRLRGPEFPIGPEAYLPMAQKPGIGGTVLVRMAEGAPSIEPVLRAAVLDAVPGVPVVVTTFEESLRAMSSQRRFNMLLVGLFGVLAIVIASVGIYGVMAYTVAQQTPEIGVRMALGARPQRVLVMVLRRASLVMLAGMTIGIAGAWMVTGLVEGFLFSVKPHDPIVFACASALLLLTGWLAALVPAIRAARVDPIVALRSE
jgi:predicted permease